MEFLIEDVKSFNRFLEGRMSVTAVMGYIDKKFDTEEKARGGDLAAIVDSQKKFSPQNFDIWEFSPKKLDAFLNENNLIMLDNHERPTWTFRNIDPTNSTYGWDKKLYDEFESLMQRRHRRA